MQIEQRKQAALPHSRTFSLSYSIMLRNLNLLMIDVKHESRYNYIELLYLMDEAFFMGAFFDWLLSNSNGIITVIVILAVAIPSLTVVRRLTKGHVSKNSCTVQTVGFIRSTRQTGLYVNENPQLLFELDALAEDGTVFQTSVRKIIPITAMAGMVPGRAIPIRYNPDDRIRAVWDDHPDESLAQERAARYLCQKHPGDLSYEQRMELLKNGVMKKALLKSFRLTGKEEAGDYEAEAAIQLAGEEQSGHTFERTLYVPNTALEYLIPGRYVDVRVIPGRENLFVFVLDTSVASGIS